jgi:hypothetical protein
VGTSSSIPVDGDRDEVDLGILLDQTLIGVLEDGTSRSQSRLQQFHLFYQRTGQDDSALGLPPGATLPQSEVCCNFSNTAIL